MYRTTKEKSIPTNAVCNECNSKSVLYKGGNLDCTNCGNTIYSAKKKNKYNAVRTVAQDGLKRDSKFEADVADELRLRVLAGDIKGYDSQYKVEIPLYDVVGHNAMTVNHKVDFRIHHNDGSFELYEAKGVETQDYKWRRKLMELFWLPNHKDHIYTVRHMGYRRKAKR
jgi:hypothetical protein